MKAAYVERCRQFGKIKTSILVVNMEHKRMTPAYILWLIRNNIANSWSDILSYYELDPMHPNSIGWVLDSNLRHLVNNGLITEDKEKFSLTESAKKILTTLDISLKELANRENNSILVNPIFSTRDSSKFSYDLFVLMPFIPLMKPVYDDHIKNVAQELNLTVARADDFYTANSIVEEVWQAIYQSKILIADCTGKNPNVFYEIGIAHTIGKPVILITNNRNDIPFDLTHIRYIVYDFTPRGMKEFEGTLRNTIKEISSI